MTKPKTTSFLGITISSGQVITAAEAICGMLTALLALLNFLQEEKESGPKRPWFVALWLSASMLGAAGSYVHAIKRRPWVRIPLLGGGVIMIVIFVFLLAYIGEVIYARGLTFLALAGLQ